jgi:NADP-dependent 3-hydroxy acid dehydrogenase YdfG
MEKLNQKNILVAGATGGIGEATARLLAQSGANVFLAGRKAEKLQELAESLRIPSERVFSIDMADPASITRMGEAVHAQIPQLDILVNATGIGIIKPMESLSLEEFRLSLQVNLEGSFMLVKTFYLS